MQKVSILSFLVVAAASVVSSCHKHYGEKEYGWHYPAVYVAKPSFLPKLKAAYLDGKYSVDVHKIVAPSFKPLPYKKGVGWLLKKPWNHHYHHHHLHLNEFNHHNVHHQTHSLGHHLGPHGHIGHHGHLGHHGGHLGHFGGHHGGYGHHHGYGHGYPHLGVGSSKSEVVVGKGLYKGPDSVIEIGKEDSTPVTSLAPINNRLPIPHQVREDAVTVVEKAQPGPHYSDESDGGEDGDLKSD